MIPSALGTANQHGAHEGSLRRNRLSQTIPRQRNRRRDRQRGEGHLKAIIWTLILALVLFTAFKVVPALFAEYQFQDGIQTLATYATANRTTPDQIRASVLKEAEKDGLPITSNDVKVEAVNGNIKINADYSVTADLGFYQWVLNFHPAASNSALY